MKLYHIEIEEILQQVCDIEANSLNEAIKKVKEKYYDAEIILEPNKIVETNFREYNYDKNINYKDLER